MVRADARWVAARVISPLGLVVVMVGALLPWLRSGERARSSYQLAGLAGRLLEGTTATVARVWLVFPLVAAVVLALHLWRPGRVLFVLTAVVSSIAAGFAVLVARAPLPGLAGLWVTLVGAALSVLGLFVAPATAAPSAHHHQTAAEGPSGHRPIREDN